MPFVEISAEELAGEVEGNVFDFLLEVANELVNQLKMEAPVGATGDLRRSFQILQKGPRSIVVGTRLDYALFVQEGTGPIDNPPPPFAPFKVWARRKLGAEHLAGPVWMKIRQEGVDANPYVDRAIDNTRAKFT